MTTDLRVPEDILDVLRRHDRVLITAHAHPDGDAMGSCLALAWALRAIGRNALVFNQDGVPGFLRFLPLPGPVLTSVEQLPCEPELVVVLDCGDRARVGEALQPLMDRVPTVDIGLAQLAMHSCYETAGVQDSLYLEQAMTTYFSSTLTVTGDGEYIIV